MLPPWLDHALLTAVDTAYALTPRKRPTAEQAADCRIISHRGERDGQRVIENTFEAFDPIRRSGVWGLEFDIRWTADIRPVVLHDATTERGHGINLLVSETPRDQLVSTVPAIPTLEAFVERYADEFHFMIELKPEPYPDIAAQSAMLRSILEPLEPVRDYHLMSLDTQLLSALHGFPRDCLVPIARFNTREISAFAKHHGCGGIGGHYFLFPGDLVQHHKVDGRKIGIGFPDSTNCLYREIHRGVDWLFSNQALKIEQSRAELLRR